MCNFPQNIWQSIEMSCQEVFCLNSKDHSGKCWRLLARRSLRDKCRSSLWAKQPYYFVLFRFIRRKTAVFDPGYRDVHRCVITERDQRERERERELMLKLIKVIFNKPFKWEKLDFIYACCQLLLWRYQMGKLDFICFSSTWPSS